ncbi:MAG: ATP-binding cassette domain-containing protein [Bacilli bacterium]|nr:ATP-binding cassette domain-containing protein [Bacilli bacterium]
MIRLNNVCKNYENHKVINNINIEFPQRGLFAILGESGCGKTTLFNIIATLDSPTKGEIWLENLNITKLNDKGKSNYRKNVCTIIYQNNYLCPYLNGQENIEMANRIKNNERKFEYYAKRLNVLNCLNKSPKYMSGGEKQRIAFIRSISCNNPVILADEPTGSLDSINSSIVMNILKEESKQKLVIIVTHDIDLAEKYADKILNLEKGIINEQIAKKESHQINEKKINDKSISLKNLFFWSFKSFINRKIRYIPIILCYVCCIVFLLLALAGKTGMNSYISYLIEKRLDYDYINLYTINENKLKAIDSNIIQILEKYKQDIKLTISFDNYLNQFLKIKNLEENEFYEIKVIDMDKNEILINNLLSEKLNSNTIEINGQIIIPYYSNSKSISENKNINIKNDVDGIIEEGEIYNTPKLYLSRKFVNNIFAGINIELIAKELSLDFLDLKEYLYSYSEFCNMPLQVIIKNKEIKTKLYNELLALKNTHSQYSLSTNTNTNTYNIIETGDEMLRTSFKDIIDMSQIVIIMLMLFLILIISSIISLMLYYSSKERNKEFALIRTFGGNKLDISKLIFLESFYISFFVIIISVFISYIISYIVYLDSRKILKSRELFNIFQFQIMDIVIIVMICFFVTLFSSFSSILKTYKANIFGIFKD